ncbi:uncharacterized protein METZ01_LOCUS31788 [marine metagenome]|uniref:Uncharacterized protein n=1 Tax=marine metagenome TaxID=408172 RepID=A0A381QJ52_9ZZZZ
MGQRTATHILAAPNQRSNAGSLLCTDVDLHPHLVFGSKLKRAQEKRKISVPETSTKDPEI